MPVRKTKSGRYKVENVKGSHATRAKAERQNRAIKARRGKE